MQNHTTQAEVGEVFEAVQPRLAIATHLNLNPHTYVPIISSIRSTYPDGKEPLYRSCNALEDLSSLSACLLEELDLYVIFKYKAIPKPSIEQGELNSNVRAVFKYLDWYMQGHLLLLKICKSGRSPRAA